MKKRAFVRYSKNGKIVPGSLILTAGSYPQGSSTWREVSADLCCLQPQDYSSCVALQGFGDESFNYGFTLETRTSGPNLTGSIYWAPGEVQHFNVPSNGDNNDFSYNFGDQNIHTVYLCVNNPSQIQDFELGFGPGTTTSVNNAYKLNGIEEWDSDNMQIGSLDLSGLTSLVQLFHCCSMLAFVNITDCVKLTTVDLRDTGLSTNIIDHVLITLDNNGLSNGFVDVSGGVMGPPSPAGVAAALSLTGKGWTVNTN